MNEGSGGQVFDLSGNGNHSINWSGALGWDSDKYGSVIAFPGSNDFFDVPYRPSVGKLTLLFWVKYTATLRGIIGLHDGTRRFYAGLEPVGGVNDGGYYFGFGNSYHQGNVTSEIVANEQVCIAITGDGNTARYWVNGVLKDSFAYTWTGVATSDFRVGEASNGAGDLVGTISHIMIYNRALSPSEVALLHREPFCMFGRVNRPELIVGQIVNLAGSSVALSSLSATVKVMRKVGGNVVGTSDVAALLNSIRSLLEVERDWLREALFNGMTANAFKLGTTLSLGWFWVRVAGCSVLYRGFSMGEIDFMNILAVDEKNALEISPSSYISHNGSSTYFYVVRRFNNCGYQERTLAASVKVSIESNGELAEPQPNKVFDSGAKLVDGNKIQLVWYYCLLEQKSQPMCFNVYYDGRTGQIDYENPLVIISYKGRKFYSYQSGALEAGRYLFAIRTEDASGKENSSLARLRIQFNTTNPDAIDILRVEGV